MVQAFLKKWWVESDLKAPNLPLSVRLKGSGSVYWTIYIYLVFCLFVCLCYVDYYWMSYSIQKRMVLCSIYRRWCYLHGHFVKHQMVYYFKTSHISFEVLWWFYYYNHHIKFFRAVLDIYFLQKMFFLKDPILPFINSNKTLFVNQRLPCKHFND